MTQNYLADPGVSTKDVCTEEKWNMNYPSFTKTSISEYYRKNVETRMGNFLHINWTHELPLCIPIYN